MLVIPAIDIIGGKCVRLRRGNYNQLIYYNLSPIEQAKVFEDMGYTHLHLVDLDGAKNGKPQNLHVLNRISLNTSLQIDFGGGIRTYEDISSVFTAGASQINLGTVLISDPVFSKTVIRDFGSEKVIAAIDCMNYLLKTHGWIKSTNSDVFETIENLINIGINRFTITDISRDGMLNGPSISLYKRIVMIYPMIKLRASGGISSIEDINDLKSLNLEAVIVGKLLYETKQLNKYDQ